MGTLDIVTWCTPARREDHEKANLLMRLRLFGLLGVLIGIPMPPGQQLSRTTKKNRLSEPDVEGTRQIKHMGGPKSAAAHAEALVQIYNYV